MRRNWSAKLEMPVGFVNDSGAIQAWALAVMESVENTRD